MQDATPETSIIIRTYNEERDLPGLLDAIRAQAYRDHEVIIVDSGSTDDTLEIAGAADRVIRIESRDFTFGYSLNVGVSAANGRYVVMVSAHTLPVDDRWLGSLVAPFQDPDVAMVYGRQLGLDGESKFSEIQDLRRRFGAERQVMRPPDFFANNANSAVRRDLWEEHAFDEHLPGLEDIEWARHWMLQGRRVVYEAGAAIYHIHRESWPQVFRRYYREAVAERRLGLRGRRHIPIIAASELANGVADGWLAARSADREAPLRARFGEILRFRKQKLLGTVRGLLDGHALEDADEREAYYFDDEYRAVVIKGRHRSALEVREVPTVRPSHVLIEMAYVGVCGTDLEILDGTLGYYADGTAHYPIVPGHEVSGTVAGAGARVEGVSRGDRVVVECIQGCGSCPACGAGNPIACAERRELGVIGRDGGYAEYLSVEGRFVHVIPDDLDLRRAALAEPMAVALKGLERLERAWTPVAGPKRCAVVGAGALGHLCALALISRGHEVTVIDRNPNRLALFDGSGVAVADRLDAAAGHDVVIEVTGDPDAAAAIVERSRPGATLLLLGLPYAHRPFSFETLVAYDRTVVGSVGSGREHFAEALRLLPRLRLDPFLEHAVPLAEYETAWKAAREGKYLKTMIAGPGAT